MALTPDKLIEGVQATLQGIAGIDPLMVHDHRREVRTESDAAEKWYSAAQSRIHAWNVTLSSDLPATSARAPGFSGTQAGQIDTDFGIVIEGVMGIDDANNSEKTFRDLAWVVNLTFNRIGLLRNVGGLVAGDVTHQDPMQWEKFGYLVLASMYAVHYVRQSCRFTGRVSP